jgi:ABC-type multidrug transport system fused ATPase/permease subunit
MVVLLPLTTLVIRRLRGLRQGVMQFSDARVKYILEVIQGIRIVKFMSWEQKFEDKIGDIRAQELRFFQKTALVQAAQFTLANTTPIAISLVTLWAYTALFGNELTASTAFTALQLLRVLQVPLQQFPNIMSSTVIDGGTALGRMSKFMQEPESEDYVERMSAAGAWKDGVWVPGAAVEIVGGTFGWASAAHSAAYKPGNAKPLPAAVIMCALPLLPLLLLLWAMRTCWRVLQPPTAANGDSTAQSSAVQTVRPVLRDINMTVPAGDLCLVIGAVGAGKTSLLHACLAELTKTQGTVRMSGPIAYTSQSAFIMNSTLRENILFGQPFDPVRYAKVIHACALAADLEQLPGGDLTAIGERGINLSGGQKQRVGLARACYQPAEVILLDDPLSAVDQHVGQHIFRHCIRGLLSGKTIIMTTHATQYLPLADKVVLLDGCSIAGAGTYEELRTQMAGGPHASLFAQVARADIEVEDVLDSATESASPIAAGETPIAGSTSSRTQDSAGDEKVPAASAMVAATTLITAEERTNGRVDLVVYLDYAQQFGRVLFLAVVLWFASAQFSQVISDWWMGRWSEHDVGWIIGYTPAWSQNKVLGYFLGVYGLLALMQVAFAAVKVIFVQLAGLRAAKLLHARMLRRLLGAPSSFFDVTPVGRIVNRFSSDMEQVDNQLANLFTGFYQQLFNFTSIIIVVTMAVPLFPILYLPVVYFYTKWGQVYRASAREIKRLNSNSKSPIFQNFNQTLNGLTTIRALGVVPVFVGKNNLYIDDNALTLKCQEAAIRWFAMRLQLCSALIVLIVALYVTNFQTGMDPARAGMALTYALSSTLICQAVIASFTQLEVSMNSVERIKHYSQVEQEGTVLQAAGPTLDPPHDWPRSPRIVFDNVSAAYRAGLPLVIDSLSLTVEAGQRVAFVGRTGSGKSTTMLLLFRFLELSSGSIELDGFDISRLPLRRLRQAIAMLPQDPVLFSGSILENLDPFGEHTEAEVWGALHRAQLLEAVKAEPQQLQQQVGEGGESFSVGQRQLMCLARALLAQGESVIKYKSSLNVPKDPYDYSWH